MRVAISCQDSIKSFRRLGDELNTLGFEQRAVVLLCESQRRGRRVNADAAGELAFTYQLEPVQPIPVKFLRVKYNLTHGDVIVKCHNIVASIYNEINDNPF
jgi:hypothetical protein